MSFGRSTTPTARKEHKCVWCPENIQPGETYYRFNGKAIGEFQYWAMHIECEEALREWQDDIPYPEAEPIPYQAHKRGENEYR